MRTRPGRVPILIMLEKLNLPTPSLKAEEGSDKLVVESFPVRELSAKITVAMLEEADEFRESLSPHP